MSCERPLTMVNPRYKDKTRSEFEEFSLKWFGQDHPPDYYVKVPCGRCRSCQISRLQGFRFRLLYELAEYPNSLFITLSFTDSALEEYKDNYNKAVCQFMDAMRKKYGKELRHFYVLEFGSEHGRPHFHGVLFGVKHLDFFDVESLWNRGNGRIRSSGTPFEGFFKRPRGIIYLEYVREPEKLSSYLCSYLTKEYSPDRPTPRVLTSRGFGMAFFKHNDISYFRRNLSALTSFGNCPYVLPAYYRNKIFSELDKLRIVDKLASQKPVYRLDGVVYSDYGKYSKALSEKHRYHVELGLSPHPNADFKRIKRSYRPHKSLIRKDFVKDFQDMLKKEK